MAKLTRSCNRHALLLSLYLPLFVSLSRLLVPLSATGVANSPQICPNRGSFYFWQTGEIFKPQMKERERERARKESHAGRLRRCCPSRSLSLSLSLWGLFCSLHVRFFTCVLFVLCHSTVICRLLQCTHTYVYPRMCVCVCVCVIVNGHRAALPGKCEGYTTRRSEAPHPPLHCSSYLSPSSKVAASCAVIYAIIS